VQFFREEDREDFEQFVALKAVEGRKATRWQLYVDYLRQSIGDKRSKSYNQKRLLHKAREFIPGRGDELDKDEIRDYRGRPFDANNRNFTELIRAISLYDKVILKLFYVWGLNELEIG